jgi:hypothetical protein
VVGAVESKFEEWVSANRILYAQLLYGVVYMTLDFNPLQVGEQVQNYYNGGLGSVGTGPGPSYGITFTGTFTAVSGGLMPPTGRAETLSGARAVMNIPGGLTSELR